MPDWQALVRQEFSELALPPHDQAELVEELANHLEELFDGVCSRGLSEQTAFEECRRELQEAGQFARVIGQAKYKEGVMNYRSRTLWLPGLVTLTLSSILLAITEFFAFSRPKVHWVDTGAIVLSGLWLLTLPFCGALGAYMSQRAGGTRLNCLIAATFPSCVMLAVFCFVLPVAIFIERNTYVIHHPLYFGLALLNWTVVPGFFLFLGAVAVCRQNQSLPQT
jgi:hypothetical protein